MRIFFVLIVVYFLLIWVSQEFVYTNTIYYRSYSGTLTQQSIEGMLGFQTRYWWVGYVFIPIILILKFTFTAICISIGATFSLAEFKFKDIFKTVMLAEVVFIVAQIIFMVILYMHLDDITLQNIGGYYPLSALSIIGIENVNAQWAIYPLQTANFFEVFYVVVISWLLSREWESDFFGSLNIIIPSYGIGLLLWVVLVAFLTFQFN